MPRFCFRFGISKTKTHFVSTKEKRKNSDKVEETTIDVRIKIKGLFTQKGINYGH